MKPTLILLIGLVLILSTLELCSKQYKIIPRGGIVQITDGKKTQNLSYTTIQRQMNQDAKAKRGSEWHGVYLSKFLTDNGIDVMKYRNCTLVAKDKMRMTIPFDEITDNQAFLTFGTDKKNSKKYLKLVMLQDDFEQRWVKYIVQIVVE
jgi:hypothetical protein